MSDAWSLAKWGTVALVLGLLPSLVMASFIGWCFDTCSDQNRPEILGTGIWLLPGVILLGMAVGLNLRQSWKKEKPTNLIAGYILPILIGVFFVVLLASVKGSSIFPYTFSEADPWIFTWYSLVAALFVWAASLLFWNLRTEITLQTARIEAPGVLNSIGMVFLCFYVGFTAWGAASLLVDKHVVSSNDALNFERMLQDFPNSYNIGNEFGKIIGIMTTILLLLIYLAFAISMNVRAKKQAQALSQS